MVCTTGSVQSEADKTTAAAAQVKKLETMLQTQEADNKKRFYDEIASHLADAKIGDAREISYNSDIKTEYTYEFSLDKVAGVVVSALNAVVKATDPTSPKPAMSKDAIDAYVDVVNKVAEAAKSSADSASSLSFSMNRLAPGLYAFLYASSVNIRDEDTFGSEAVTSTAIYYRLMQSPDDIKNEAAFGATIIDAKNYIDMKALQAALTDDLASGKLTIEEWSSKDEAFSKAVDRLKKRLDAAGFDTSGKMTVGLEAGFGPALDHSFASGSPAVQGVVRTAIETLSSKGGDYERVVAVSQQRLESGYY